MAVAVATKKEQIVHLATQDPFLTVAEIAAVAGTTARYVRTALSEARLSLEQLRRSYARTIEARLSAAPSQTSGNAQNLPDLQSGLPCICQVTDAVVAQALGHKPGDTLLCITCVRSQNDVPLYVEQVMAADNPVVIRQQWDNQQPLRFMLGFADACYVQTKPIFDIVRSDALVAQSLRLVVGSPVLRTTSFIAFGSKTVGAEYTYFDAFKVKLTHCAETGIKIIEKVAEHIAPATFSS